MNRFTKICLALGLLLLIAGLIISAVGVFSGGIGDIRNYRPESGTPKLLQLPAEGISHLEIMASYEDVHVLPGADDTIGIDYSETETNTYEYTLTASTVDGKQVCTFIGKHNGDSWDHIHFGFWEENTDITVYLPKGMSLSIHTASGDVSILQVTVEDVMIMTASGDVKTEAISATDLQITTTSGDVDLDLTQCKNASIKTVSGDVEAENLTLTEGDTLYLKTTSGEISLHDSTVPGNVDITSVSGEVEAIDTAVSGDLHVKTTSGNVDIMLTSVDDHRIETETTSGVVETSGGSSNADKVIAVNTVSGDIRVGDSH